MYNKAMKEMFKQIHSTMIKALRQKTKSPENYDRNWWWTLYGKNSKGLTPLRRPTTSKKSQAKED